MLLSIEILSSIIHYAFIAFNLHYSQCKKIRYFLLMNKDTSLQRSFYVHNGILVSNQGKLLPTVTT